MYLDLELWQMDVSEVWQRGWIIKMMTGDVKSEEYNSVITSHLDPYHPEE